MSSVSKTDECPTISDLFSLLDRWRHLPNYQLERRADIFFALFLPEVLRAQLRNSDCCVEINPELIPEFPIKENGSNRSKKIDYLALSMCGERAFLVELKTDMESIDPEQIQFLKDAACRGVGKAISGLKSIAKSKSVMNSPQIRKKYFHLFSVLEQLNLIDIPNIEDLKRMHKGDEFRKKCYADHVDKIEIRKCPRKLEVVYILPEDPRGKGYEQKKKFEKINELMDDKVKKIYFGYFSEYAKGLGVIGERFAESLGYWEKQAGLCIPENK